GPTIDLYGVSPQDNHEVIARIDRWIPEGKHVEMEDFSKNKNVVVGDVVDGDHQQHHQLPQEDY
ncbi:hypothetical protein H5410_062391, partial [Solanum commersonii]